MELQVFDSAGELRFKAREGDPVWAVLGLAPGTIAGADLDALAQRLDAEVRRLRAELPAQPEPGGYDEVTLDVLGERLQLNARHPLHQGLRRANRIRESVRDAAGAGLTLRAIAAPKLSPEQFRVASLLKRTEGGIPARALPVLVEDQLGELSRRAETDAIATSLARERATWEDPDTPARTIAELEAAGLVTQDPDGTVRTTPDLELLRI